MEVCEENSKKIKKEKPGIVYLSRIPRRMNVKQIRHVFGSFGEVGRVFWSLLVSLRYRVVKPVNMKHSLTALDRLRVVAISTRSGPALRNDRHWWVDPYLPPPVEAKFSVHGPAGTSSQWQEVCRWRHQWIDVIFVFPWIIGRCYQKVSDVDRRLGKEVDPLFRCLIYCGVDDPFQSQDTALRLRVKWLDPVIVNFSHRPCFRTI